MFKAEGKFKLLAIIFATSYSGLIVKDKPKSSLINFKCLENSGFLTLAIVSLAPNL